MSTNTLDDPLAEGLLPSRPALTTPSRGRSEPEHYQPTDRHHGPHPRGDGEPGNRARSTTTRGDRFLNEVVARLVHIGCLTPRVAEALRLHVHGWPSALAAEEMGCAHNTYRKHVSAALRHVGAESTAELFRVLARDLDSSDSEPQGSVQAAATKPFRARPDLEFVGTLTVPLCALVPPPGAHTVRYYGVLARRHALRARIIPYAGGHERRAQAAVVVCPPRDSSSWRPSPGPPSTNSCSMSPRIGSRG